MLPLVTLKSRVLPPPLSVAPVELVIITVPTIVIAVVNVMLLVTSSCAPSEFADCKRVNDVTAVVVGSGVGGGDHVTSSARLSPLSSAVASSIASTRVAAEAREPRESVAASAAAPTPRAGALRRTRFAIGARA